jgi:hypothetical protein
MILLALALTAGLSAVPPAPPDTARTIFGQWHYNRSLSDEQHAYVGTQGEGFAGGYGGGPMGGGGSRGGGGMGGNGGGGEGMHPHGGPPPGGIRTPSDAQKAAHQELVALALRAPAKLELRESDGTLTVVADTAAPIALRTDGHKVKWMTADSVKVETNAKWEYGRLVVEHDVHGAGKVTYTFYLSPDASELFVAVAVYPTGGPTRPVPFRRVYDPAGAGPVTRGG